MIKWTRGLKGIMSSDTRFSIRGRDILGTGNLLEQSGGYTTENPSVRFFLKDNTLNTVHVFLTQQQAVDYANSLGAQ